jgi:hypothetical protein
MTKTYQGAYEESIDKARILLSGRAVFKRLGGQISTKERDNGYFVSAQVADTLRIKGSTSPRKALLIIAAWIDALPYNGHEIISYWTDDDVLVVECVIYHETLWGAMVEAASRVTHVIAFYEKVRKAKNELQ